MHINEAEANWYKNLYDCLPSICFVVDSAATVVVVNQFGADRLGYAADWLEGQKILSFFHPEDRDKIEAELLAFWQPNYNKDRPEKVVAGQYRLERKDGSILRGKMKICRTEKTPNLDLFIVVFDETNLDTKIVDKENLNINEEQELSNLAAPLRPFEENNWEPETKYKLIFDNLPIGISITDSEGNVIEANQAAKEILGINEAAEKYGCVWCRGEEEKLETGNWSAVTDNFEMTVPKNKITRYFQPIKNTRIPLKEGDSSTSYMNVFALQSTQEELEKSLSLLQATLESTVDGIVAFNLEREVVCFNQNFVQMWQVPDEIMTSERKDEILDFVLGQLKEPESFFQRIDALYKQPSTKTDDIWELKNGKVYKRYTQPQLIGEKIVGRVWSFRDVTEQKIVEETLRQQAERERLFARMAERIRNSLNLEEILNTTVEEVRQFLVTDRVLIYRFDSDWSGVVAVESVDINWKSILGTAVKDPCFRDSYVHQYQQGRILAIEDISTADLTLCHFNLLSQFQVKANLVVPILQGEHLWGLLIAHNCSSPRQWQESEIQLLKQLATQVAIAIKQAELYQKIQQANLDLQRLAALDGLTQVANRRRFDEYIELEWRRLSRDNLPLSLILCDVDFFKLYNDRYGHLAGDFCLQQVANAIKSAAKRPADLVARYGGEEFAVILPNTTSEGAINVARSICQKVRDLALEHTASHVSHFVTLSLGVASNFPNAVSSPAKLIAATDMALYEAKNQGRDRIVVNQLI